MQRALTGRGAHTGQALAYARACWPDGTTAEQHLLALHLSAILALDDALDKDRSVRSADHELSTLLPWCAPPGGSLDAPRLASRRAIRAALARVEQGLAATPSRPGCALQSWRIQGELMARAMWREARWRARGILPDEGAYLAVSEVSIGIGWIVATLLLLDGARSGPPRPDDPVMIATAALAAAIRVANDLHEPRREQREGKVQLLFLRARALRSLGFDFRSAERHARDQLRAELLRRAARARALLDDRALGVSPRVRAGLRGMLAEALRLIDAQQPPARDMGAAAWATR